VFWTLCLEIQFYLAYVVLVFLAQRLARGRVELVLGPVWLLAIAVATGAIYVGHALFLWAWPYFFLGVVTSWQVAGRLSSRRWALITGATCVLLLWSHSRWITAHDAPERTAITAATTAGLYLAGRLRRDGRSLLQTATLGRPLQYLGRISYSWYLTHVLVGWAAARLGLYLVGEPVGQLALIGLLVGCLALTVAGAHVLHVVVERPAHALSRRIALAPPAR
jgi:peptidoglycan/LPS O-acetylase OafA/YrhL